MWHALLLTRSNVNVVTLCVGHGLALSGQWGIVVNLDIVEIHPRQILDVRFQFIRQASFVLCHRNPLAKITANPTEIRSSIPVGLVCHNTESLIRFDSLAASPSRPLRFDCRRRIRSIDVVHGDTTAVSENAGTAQVRAPVGNGSSLWWLERAPFIQMLEDRDARVAYPLT
jgi:hypothetical protein